MVKLSKPIQESEKKLHKNTATLQIFGTDDNDKEILMSEFQVPKLSKQDVIKIKFPKGVVKKDRIDDIIKKQSL